jgi:hypothetical protein
MDGRPEADFPTHLEVTKDGWMVLEKGLQGRGLKAACYYIQPAIAADKKGGLSFYLTYICASIYI